MSALFNGNTKTNLVTSLALNTSATSSSNAGAYAITPSAAASPNYTISFVNGSLTVTPVPLTITAQQQKQEVRGRAADLDGQLCRLCQREHGHESGDSADPEYVGLLLQQRRGLSITGSAAASPNYVISFVTGSLTVTLASLTISAKDESMSMGSAVPPLTANYKGFVNGDTSANLAMPPSLTTHCHLEQSRGKYPIDAGAAASPNYAIAYVDGVLTVTKMQLVSVAVTSATNSIPVVVEIENLTVLPDRQVQLTLTGQPGQAYVLEMSPDLINWQVLQTNTLADANTVFVDQTATQADRRSTA